MKTLVFLVFLCSLISLSFGQIRRSSEEEKMTSALSSIFQGFDKRIRPNYGVSPVEVGITAFILSIHSLSENNMDFTLDFYFRQMWTDPRLNFQGYAPNTSISFGQDILKEIWIPSTFFVNSKLSEGSQTASPTPEQFVKISSDGEVLFSMRSTKTFSCPMDLRYFPMDKPLCTVEIESFGHKANEVFYKWARGDKSIGISNSLYLPQFKVVGHKQLDTQISLPSGAYSRLTLNIQFARFVSYYLTEAYYPAAALVIMSWVSFWINRKAVTARVLIALLSTLALFFLTVSIKFGQPKISYIKAIDFYLGFCCFIAILALLEVATVDYLTGHSEPNRDTDKSKLKKIILNRLKINPVMVDLCSRVGFPVLFIVYNITYWSYYMYVGNSVEDDLILLK